MIIIREQSKYEKIRMDIVSKCPIVPEDKVVGEWRLIASCIKLAPHTEDDHPMRKGINLVTLFFLRRRVGWLANWVGAEV